MEKVQFEVMTLDSESEDEVQILSETIVSYGNIATSLEITPEIQEKINRLLRNYVPFQVDIKVIKAYSRKKNDNSVGTASISFLSTNGQGAKVINLGAASAFFASQILGGTNNNSSNKKRATQVATDSEKVLPQKCFPTDNAEVQTAKPSSSVILDSPIRKIKVKRLREKRGIARKTNSPASASPPIEQSSPDSTPPWYQNISPSFNNNIVDEDSSKYKSNMAKNVEDIRQSSSVKDQTSTSEIFRNISQYAEIENRRPCPTSPPTEACISTLSQMNPAEFGALVGLCEVDADNQTRKRINIPKRVLRKRAKN